MSLPVELFQQIAGNDFVKYALDPTRTGDGNDEKQGFSFFFQMEREEYGRCFTKLPWGISSGWVVGGLAAEKKAFVMRI